MTNSSYNIPRFEVLDKISNPHVLGQFMGTRDDGLVFIYAKQKLLLEKTTNGEREREEKRCAQCDTKENNNNKPPSVGKCAGGQTNDGITNMRRNTNQQKISYFYCNGSKNNVVNTTTVLKPLKQ